MSRENTFFDLPQLRIFLITFIVVFLVVGLQYLGVHTPKLLIPVEFTKDSFAPLKEKLHMKKNLFYLQKPAQYVPKLQAAEQLPSPTAYTVIDTTNKQILYEKSSSTKYPIASLTKVMTAVVALDLAKADEQFTVSKHAAAQIPTKIGVVAGEKMSLEELLYATLLTSANDAVEVIKEGINAKYGEDIFVKAMNEKATFLGLTNTHFTNPQGFDAKDNYSSAEDLAILSHYALTNYPLIAQIAQKEYVYIAKNSFHKQFDLYNWNGLLGVYPQIKGLKIGNTERAGKTIIAVSNREGKQIIVVLLGAPGILERDLWTSELFDAGYTKLTHLPKVNIKEENLQAKYNTWEYWN